MAWAFRRLPLADRLVGEFILCQAMGLVTSLNGMDPQMENLGLPGTWASLYMGLMGLCCVLTGSCIIVLHWRKKLLRERRAQQWVELMNASTFTYSPLVYWINMQRCHDINASIKIGPPTAVTNTAMNINIPDCLWESDTPEGRGYGLRDSSPKAETPVALKDALVVSRKPQCIQMPQHQTPSTFPIPIFQEIPFAPPLHKMPSMLEHTVSYPLDIYPEKNAHYHSHNTLALE